jgi:hypothetical protein
MIRGLPLVHLGPYINIGTQPQEKCRYYITVSLCRQDFGNWVLISTSNCGIMMLRAWESGSTQRLLASVVQTVNGRPRRLLWYSYAPSGIIYVTLLKKA